MLKHQQEDNANEKHDKNLPNQTKKGQTCWLNSTEVI